MIIKKSHYLCIHSMDSTVPFHYGNELRMGKV